MTTVLTSGPKGYLAEYESSHATLWPRDKTDRITYQHALQATTISSPPNDVWSFGSADIQNRDQNGLTYSKTIGSSAVTASFGSWWDLKYVSAGTIRVRRIENLTGVDKEVELVRTYLFGSPTRDIRTPQPNPLEYQLQLVEHGRLASESGANLASGSLAVDFAAGTISGTLATPSPMVRNRVNFDGVIDTRTNWITGTMSSPDVPYSGEFAGRLYGSEGRELALFYAATAGDGVKMSGHVIGRTNFVTLP